MIPGAKEVVEVDGAKIFFPEERPGDLVPRLSRHWGRQRGHLAGRPGRGRAFRVQATRGQAGQEAGRQA